MGFIVFALGTGGTEGSMRPLNYGPLEQVRLAKDEVDAILGKPPFYIQSDASSSVRRGGSSSSREIY